MQPACGAPTRKVAPECSMVGGCLVGVVVGTVIGRALYRSANDRAVVVNVGRAGLPTTLRAAFSVAVLAGVLVAGLPTRMMAAAVLQAVLSRVCGERSAGTLFAFLASLA